MFLLSHETLGRFTYKHSAGRRYKAGYLFKGCVLALSWRVQTLPVKVTVKLPVIQYSPSSLQVVSTLLFYFSGSSETVLVTAAAGAVGLAAVDLAANVFGCKVNYNMLP